MPVNNQSFKTYDALYPDLGRTLCPELTALTAEEYDRAISDPRTAVWEAGGLSVPLVTPIENLNWYNGDYFRQVAAAAAPIMYYDHLSGPYRRNHDAYTEAVAESFHLVAEKGGLVAMDHLDHDEARTEDELAAIFEKLGLFACDILPAFDPSARHFNYASRMRLADSANIRPETLSFEGAADYLPGKLGEGVSVELVLGEDELEHVWPFYSQRFAELTANDPIVAASPKQELRELFQNPRILKAVQRVGGRIASLCMYSDVRNIAWANQAYYAQAFPDEYESGHVLFSPGAITAPDSAGDARTVMAAVGPLVATAGIERSVMTFVCNKLSYRPVSTIGHWVLNRRGLMTDLRTPVSQRIFHAYKLRGGYL